MQGKVIQGFFVSGRPAAAFRDQSARAGHAGPPAPAFAARPVAAVRPAAPVQRYGGNGQSIPIDTASLGLAASRGSALPAPLLAKMESAFAADFSGVRIHVGTQAPRIGALAFTMGDDIYFAPGRYQPGTPQGQQLIGHELAHVIQQRQGRVRGTGPGVSVVQDFALEAEADRLGLRAAQHNIQAKMAPRAIASPVVRAPGPPRPAHLAAGHGKHSGCGCGGGCGSKPVQRAVRPGPPAAIQRAAEVDTSSKVLHYGGRRYNPYRAKGGQKRLTKRQMGIASSARSRSSKNDCRLSRPSKPLGREVWNGSSRRVWTDDALTYLANHPVCEVPGCANASTAIDHISPYKAYIDAHSNPITICDGTCHFIGVAIDEADALYSDENNIRAICTACNSAKASADKKDPQNVAADLTPAGPCPNAPNGCGGGDCNADVCL